MAGRNAELVSEINVGDRLIVAVCFLDDTVVALLDRQNDAIVLTDVQSGDVVGISELSEINGKKGQPSDINKTFKGGELLVTYTYENHSTAHLYNFSLTGNRLSLQEISRMHIPERSRSVVCLDDHLYAALTEYSVIIITNDGRDVGKLDKRKPDRGGLLMSMRNGGMTYFYFGDRGEFVGCCWDGRNASEIFRRSERMNFPRGSDVLGDTLLVACDSARRIVCLSADGRSSVDVVTSHKTKQFGDSGAAKWR